MGSTPAVWLVLLIALIAANLPFVNERLFVVGPGRAPKALGWRLLVEWGGTIFSAGLIISLPVVAALLIANVAVGIMTRAAPQLNIFAVGFPVTLVTGFVAIYLAAPYIGPALVSLFEQAMLAIGRVVDGLAPR